MAIEATSNRSISVESKQKHATQQACGWNCFNGKGRRNSRHMFLKATSAKLAADSAASSVAFGASVPESLCLLLECVQLLHRLLLNRLRFSLCTRTGRRIELQPLLLH